jgi:hypothetical protein
MKRFILTVLALVAFCCVQASAQGFGVTAGMNFNSAKVKEESPDALPAADLIDKKQQQNKNTDEETSVIRFEICV